MSDVYKTDLRDAIPSWSGYNYQGQIAIVTILDLMNKIKSSGDDITQYELKLEDIEDFSIYNNGKVKSIHQVKASRTTAIGSFAEALYYLATDLTGDANEAEAAYLHTACELTSENWEIEIKSTIEKYLPEKISRLKAILSDADALNEEVRILRTKIKANCHIDGRISKERLTILRALQPISSKYDIKPECVYTAIKEYLDRLPEPEFSDELIYRRIKCYKYVNGRNYLPTIETIAAIENQITEYWGEDIARLREANISVYRNQLQQVINDHVRARHSDPRITKCIPLTQFNQVLMEDIPISGEQRILMEKDFLFILRRNYCEYECTIGDNCDACDLDNKMELFGDMCAAEFEKFCYMLSPHVREDIDQEPSHLLDTHGLYGSTFPSLHAINHIAQTENNRLVYLLDKHYMLTDIHLSKPYKGSILRNILKNPTVERICGAIKQNREIGPLCMEIDSLVVSDDTEQGIPDIFEAAHSIGYKSLPDEGQLSYMKITHKKLVSMTAAAKLIKEYGREKA